MAACWDDPSLYLDEAVELLNQKNLYDYSEHAMRSVLTDLKAKLEESKQRCYNNVQRMIFLLLLLNYVNTQQLEHWAIQRNEEERAADLTEIAYTDAECLAFVDEMSAKSRHFRRRLLGRAMRGKPVRIREMTSVLCLVLDNCTLHHSEKVKQYVSNRNIKLENLPRYSPDFNPIELCFSKLLIEVFSRFQSH